MSGESPRNRIAAAAKVMREHLKRNPVRGCIVTRWICTCGEETEEFDAHLAKVMLAAADEIERPMVEQLAAALRLSEWVEIFSDYDVGDFVCGACGNARHQGHDPSCEITNALAPRSLYGR